MAAASAMAGTAAPSMAVPAQPVRVAPSLPRADSSDLGLVHPTDHEKREHMKKNGDAWRGPLSIETYLRREDHLSRQGLTKDSGITYWVLVDTTLPHHDRVVLAGCETIKKRALLSKNGKLTDGVCHGVGSVFTPKEYRGRGYADRMMLELGRKLRKWQSGHSDALFSVLYSDIGKTFYSKRGWIACPSAHVHLPPEPERISNYQHTLPLTEQDLHALCDKDEALIRARMANWHGSTAIALIPDYKTIEWHHARENFVANELYGRRPVIKGAIAQLGDLRVWAIWTRVWYNENRQKNKDNRMYILRLVVDAPNTNGSTADRTEDIIKGITSVLHFAQREAHEWHMEFVEVWNPHTRTFAAAQRLDPFAAVTHRENDSIASLKWYGEPEESVDWLENEKYGWC